MTRSTQPEPPRRGSRTRYTAERRAFDWLRTNCSTSARHEYEQAVRTLLERYNTTIYENRFVAGGAVEVFTYALLRSVGIDCTLYGDQAKSGDILLPNDRKLSVKGIFKGSVGDVRILNQMGGGDREWNTATLFVVSGTGIVFGAPDMVAPDHVKPTGDAKVLKRVGLQVLVDDPANVIEMEIARKPPTVAAGFSQKASTAVAQQILREKGLSTLAQAFPNLAARSA